MKGRRVLVAMGLAIAFAFVLLPAWLPLPRFLVWNASASVPVGLYWVRPIAQLRHGDLVVVDPPEPLATLLVDRGYLGQHVPLIKRVAALPGQIICRFGDRVLIDGRLRARARARDGLERALPVWQGCQVLRLSEVFLLNAEHPASLDGRYFGPLPQRSILGHAVPLWTREAL